MPIDRVAATLALDDRVHRLPGVKQARAQALEKMGIRTVRDLLTHFPRRYLDLSRLSSIANARIGDLCTTVGTIHEMKLKRPRRKLSIVEITLVDETGTMIISVFHQPWLMKKMKAGDRLAAAGKVEFNYNFKRMTNPYMELLGEEHAEGRVIPIHPATERISPAWMRILVQGALDHTRGLLDPIPLDLRIRNDLVSRGAALEAVHFPSSMDEVDHSKRRLIYEELLLLQLFLLHEDAKRNAELDPVSHRIDGERVRALGQSLPFRLTGEQERARSEILEGMARPKVSNHMLLGDVGTGKTVVAAFALAAAVDSGGQVLVLAPTEVLANQHAATLGELLAEVGVSSALLTGATAKDQRRRIIEDLGNGDLDVLIGTHALLEDDVDPKRLTLVVIDEQQRFGVDQRAAILAKGAAPDALFLTATPIPRTLALTLFGNLTLSYITERPHAGARRDTHVLPRQSRGRAYDAAKEALERGERVYVVCPLIGAKGSSDGDDAGSTKGGAAGSRATEDHGSLDDGLYHPEVAIESERDCDVADLTAVEDEAAFLRSKVFIDHTVGLLHGGMSSAEKADVMTRFQSGEIEVLVSTTVIEVGVDVPEATVMIIEDANMFGLSQLHQLRGRVGRSDLDSQVFLISSTKQEQALERLSVLARSDDGFEIARYDLALRREGDILGSRQSGSSALKLVNVIRDGDLIERAHEDAKAIIEVDPFLRDPQHAALAREVRMLFKDDDAISGG